MTGLQSSCEESVEISSSSFWSGIAAAGEAEASDVTAEGR